GAVLLALGVLTARPLLRAILVPEEILDSASLYLQLRFVGIPFLMIFTFGCVLLRAAGDTRRPLCYLTVAGVVNVLLNLLFVIVFKWDVAGVALATAASKGLAAALVLRALAGECGPGRLIFRRIKFYAPVLKRILWLGIPSGLQSSCYWIANVIIQAAINTFGALTIAGNTAGVMLEAILHTVTFAMYQSVLSFAGQNYGARKYDRVARSILICLFIGMASSLVLGWGAYFCGRPLLGLFNRDPGVIEQGMIRLQIIFTTYFLVGALDVVGGGLRGVGRSVAPAVVSLVGVCGFRIWWVLGVLPHFNSLKWLYITYPISWGIASLCNGAMLFVVCRRLLRRGEDRGYGFCKRA
ncbi:MAG: polysaccharide biosynthesis C-terminal domain-containing protein, partial [Lentisphaeria bacterium]|nr:polysaccharide biosynthesis C-terminal domain-containing protein [Lentisphaeria bacterium]